MKKILILAVLLLVLSGTFALRYRNEFINFGSLQTKQITPTPLPAISKTCDGSLTLPSIEGPYYKKGSPLKTDFQKDAPGEKFILEGYVFDTNCNPLANAWLDFWQANSQGVYDNDGFLLRGHQHTDINGRYRLATIIPGEYEQRTIHIHVMVKSNQGPKILTTQLFFPDQARSLTDPIFSPHTLIKIDTSKTPKTGYFNFVIE